jgi:DNA-binding MarR family transcriptional regulator
VEGAEVDDAARDLKVAIGRIARRMRQLYGADEVTFSEASVLARLHKQGPATPGALALDERVRPQAMGATLLALEQRGLIARSPDPADGRRVRISLTEAGRSVIVDKSRAMHRRLARVLAEEFTEPEQRQLIDVVPLLSRLAERF